LKPVESLHLRSPAKINLRLEILRKREDGYHELRTVFQKISLYDRLHFFLKKERGISIKVDHPGLPTGGKNLVYQAAQSLLKKSGYHGGVEIKIEKTIPLGAGLGGGSSNAATALMALNRLLRRGLSDRELMTLGVAIGADVPFFFFEGSAIGTGIGEKLKKVELPTLWYLLIYPGFEVSTRWAYQNFVLTKKQFHFKFQKLFDTPERISQILLNDLEAVVSSEYPQIGLMKNILSSCGALGVLMTGSGPSVFGMFPTKEEATKAYRKVKNWAAEKGWTVFKAHSIP
jgi:4-diphosphocytidyl-2-C-methyl-D-erythritol kinase